MKKLAIIVLCFSILSSLHSQIYLGGKVGIAPSYFSFQNSQPNHKGGILIPNIMAGIMMEYPVVYGFSIQPEIQFVQRGSNLKANLKDNKGKVVIPEGNYFSDNANNQKDDATYHNGLPETGETFKLPNLYENIRIKMNYIEAHLMFKYEMIGSSTGFYFEAGPYYSQGLKAKGSSTLIDKDKKKTSPTQLVAYDAAATQSYTDAVKSFPNVNKINRLDFDPFKEERPEYHLKKSDLGVAAGAGIYKELGVGRMYFDLRFLLGLTDIKQKKVTGSSIKSRSAQLSITYLYPIGG